MRRSRLLRPAVRFLLPLAVLAVVAVACCGPLFCQETLPKGVSYKGAVTAEQRAELYRTLRQHAEVLEAQAAVIKSVAKLVGPTVVYIEAERPPKKYARQRVEEAGSGVIIQSGDKFYVLTNWHVIEGCKTDKIKINLADGRQIHPEKAWGDAGTDVAVMAISTPNLVAVPVGDSDKMEVGDFVLAAGSPFGLSNSVTFGIISAKGRRDLQLGDATILFQDFLQTDASINPGNSGGPLINLRGEIIGINSAIASNSGRNEGIGFAIPINMFMIVGRQLIERGEVSRAFLGVNLDASFGPATAAEAGLPFPTGARITAVTKGTPAETAKLQIGDIILEFNNVRIEDDAHLVNLVSLTEVGKSVSLVIFRDRKPITLQVTVGDRAKLKPK
ncbi:MAG: trypsin-like peptidase domain-containing protein [Candidatus Nealsonbacteria bacterium]|nr:trypsin-like peptidase domain-containing protein [Candidatus Nealsonbacteria bacterium]